MFYGFQLSALSCLGKPIIHSSLNIYATSSVDHWLGLFNLAFGLGKMTGSLIAGSFAKAIGKIHVLYLAEIFNVVSCVLIYFPSPGLFLAGRVVAGICCGFNSTCAPRLMLENYPTKYRGIPPALYGLCLTIGVCWSYSVGKIFGDTELQQYWYIIMIGPGILLIASHLVVALFFNHESPIYYAVKAKETTDPAKK
jgi:MFS family permease